VTAAEEDRARRRSALRETGQGRAIYEELVLKKPPAALTGRRAKSATVSDIAKAVGRLISRDAATRQ